MEEKKKSFYQGVTFPSVMVEANLYDPIFYYGKSYGFKTFEKMIKFVEKTVARKDDEYKKMEFPIKIFGISETNIRVTDEEGKEYFLKLSIEAIELYYAKGYRTVKFA